MDAVLFTRAWPMQEAHEAFDRWQLEKHLPDLIQGPGIALAGYYRTVLAGLPAAYHGSGSCMASYAAPTLADLFAWLRSPVVPAAIEDGSRWFGKFNELDGSTYTGNVYEVRATSPGGRLPPDEALVLAERFEVPADDEPEFDRWLLDSHLPRIATQPGVLQARAFAAVREDIPIDYYLSPGNRMLQIEVDGGAGLEPLLADAFTDALSASLAWDLRLPYVRRDVYRPLGHVRAARRPDEGG